MQFSYSIANASRSGLLDGVVLSTPTFNDIQKIWRNQTDNQKSQIDGQTIQWQKDKGQTDKKWST